MPFQPTTQLQAVNVLLGTIGEAPVDSLTGLATVDASTALAVLNEVTQDFQGEGWYFNTDKNVQLLPDGNGNIWLAVNTASVEIDKSKLGQTAEPILSYDAASGTPKLYDRLNQTSTFTRSVWAAKIIYWRDWNQLPESARRYVTVRSARIFADRAVGAETTHQFTAQDEAAALRKFKSDDGSSVELSFFGGPDISDWLYRGAKGTGFRW